MMQRTSLLVVVALLSSLLLAAADGDLPDLEKVIENHKAILESIRTGRITYVRESTLGTDNLEEFKQHYRKDAEKKLKQAKAARADKDYLQELREQLNNYADEAARQLMKDTEHQRVSYVFDKNAGAVKSHHEDLRDVAGLMSRYGVTGEVQKYTQTQSQSIANETRKILSGWPTRLNIDSWKQRDLSIVALWYSGYLTESVPTKADGQYIKSVKMRRDADNPNLIIHEVVYKPWTVDLVFVRKGGKFRSVQVPRDKPRTSRRVTVLDESNDYRIASITKFKNGRILEEYGFEYSSDDPISLPEVVTITSYSDDGSVERTHTRRLESVELNVEIAAAEFEIDVPSGTTIYDFRGPEMLVITPDELDELAEEIEDVLEEEGIETTPAEVEEVPAEEPEAPAAAAIEEAEAPAPAKDDGGGSLMTVGIAVIVIAAIIAIALWARRRQD